MLKTAQRGQGGMFVLQAHTPRYAWSRALPGAIAAAGLLAACTASPIAADKPVVTKPVTIKPGAGQSGSQGGSLVPNGGSNLVPNGGSNLVPNGGASIVGNAGAGFGGKHGGLGAQLRDLAAIAHTRAAAGILASNGAGVVSNNNAGILASNGAGLIANNTAGIIANNASGVVAGNTGNLVPQGGAQAVSNGGATYSLFQAAPAFVLTAQAGEGAAQEAAVPDGTTAIVFDHENGNRRIVVVNAARQPLEQQTLTGIVQNAGGVITSSHTDRELVYGNTQAKRGHLVYDETYDESGALLSLTHAPSELVEPKSGLSIQVDKLAFTFAPQAGAFAIRFTHLKAKETGTITQVTRNVGGKLVGIDLADPLSTLGGTSRFETDDGQLLFERQTDLAADGRLHVVLTMRDGYAFDLTRASRGAPYTGTVSLNGKRLGTATLSARADASVAYAITFDGETAPFVLQIPDAAPAAKP